MESVDFSTTTLSEWERETLRTIATNGRMWKICRDRHKALIEWAEMVP
jgi:hypothetical protein